MSVDTPVLVARGSLTDVGRDYVRRLAESGFSTEEIMVLLPDAPRQSVIAHVAVAHRKPR